jgi:murein DD-endopeptidase MepM/ murein hydrolase activator NlpD
LRKTCQSRRSFLTETLGAIALADGRLRAATPGRNEILSRAVELNVGESSRVTLSNGRIAVVRVEGVHETRDSVYSALRGVEVDVRVEGRPVRLECANYHLPVTVGEVQIDCPFTRPYLEGDVTGTYWSLEKDVRLRLWPKDSPLVDPVTFVYPLRQRWFASATQMANEPVYVDGGEDPLKKPVYYHGGCDLGGVEGVTEVVAATDGVMVSLGKAALPGPEGDPPKVRYGNAIVDATRYDVIYLRDDRGWYYRYAHLKSFAPGLEVGQRVKMGQLLGILGKEGGAGWSHTHFEIKARQPSGNWGTEEGYAILWEAYQRQYKPELIAVARPHHFARVGEKVVLDGRRSWSRSGKIVSYEWSFTDGGRDSGPTVERSYARPGYYSEALKITDSQQRTDYDFTIVQVVDPAQLGRVPLISIHAAYAPTMQIHRGQVITFKVLTFGTQDGVETWDFADGTPPVTVKSVSYVRGAAVNPAYAATTHAYAKPGDYLVRVERSDRYGQKAVNRLFVRVQAS